MGKETPSNQKVGSLSVQAGAYHICVTCDNLTNMDFIYAKYMGEEYR